MSEAGFHVDGYSVVRLTSADAADLQDLFERCTDFHELSEGFPTRPMAGADELDARPAGKELVDKFSFGIYAPAGELIGYLDLMRNYPAAAERFWRREGFEAVRRDPTVSDTGKPSRLIVMCNRDLSTSS